MNPLATFTLQLEALGHWAPVLFVLAYTLATLAFIPGAVLTLAAGAIFGFTQGILLVFIGAVIGSSLAFCLARWLVRERVSSWLSKDQRMLAVGQAVSGQGLMMILLLRLSPVIPYNMVNYALGLTHVKYREFLIGSLGMLPGTFFYTYSGKVVGDVAVVASGIAAPRGPAYYTLLLIGLIATGAMLVLLTQVARKALAQSVKQ
jgi:uncharacterized membrane protein YdjX (TVP38/TMEM64 family)